MATPAMQIQGIFATFPVAAESTVRTSFIVKDLAGVAIDVHTGYSLTQVLMKDGSAAPWINAVSATSAFTASFAADGTVNLDCDCAALTSLVQSTSGTMTVTISNDSGTTYSLAAAGSWNATKTP